MDSTDILIHIRKITRSVHLESKRIWKDYGVSIPQVLCLNYLKNAPGFQSSLRDLKTYLNLNSSTVTGIVQRLEKKGLIARLPNEGDKRKILLVLTAPGYALIDQIPALLHDRLNAKLIELSPDELFEMERVLHRLVGMMHIEHVASSPFLENEINGTI
ncbi:MAG TPA: MarR family transcriptional regulator [Prolixibacteraceae bacterium]|nr:MarR family transcriptional regulator [Prolixibacteraceae bacterium]